MMCGRSLRTYWPLSVLSLLLLLVLGSPSAYAGTPPPPTTSQIVAALNEILTLYEKGTEEYRTALNLLEKRFEISETQLQELVKSLTATEARLQTQLDTVSEETNLQQKRVDDFEHSLKASTEAWETKTKALQSEVRLLKWVAGGAVAGAVLLLILEVVEAVRPP